MTVKEIVYFYLKSNGFDGLYNGGGCSCVLSDLFPCEGTPEDCMTGYKVQCNQDCGEPMNCIGPDKNREKCYPDED